MTRTAPADAVARISGSTRLFGVIGDPVQQVHAPGLLNVTFARLGVDAVLVPVHAPAARLTEVVRGLQAVGNLDGLLVTVPHKVAVCELADRFGPAAEASGSANALRREPGGGWYAENFDGSGFVAGLRQEGHDPRGWRVAVVGAGGAGSAIAAALLAAEVAELRLVDRAPGRLAAVRRRLAPRWPDQLVAGGELDTSAVDIVVNATPLGLRADDGLPFVPDRLPAHTVVADIVMTPHDTPLLVRAAALGYRVHHGIHMLTHQLDEYVRFFGIAD